MFGWYFCETLIPVTHMNRTEEVSEDTDFNLENITSRMPAARDKHDSYRHGKCARVWLCSIEI